MTLPTDKATIELRIATDPSVHDRLIAELDVVGFEAFMQTDDELLAYMSASAWSEAMGDRVQSLVTSLAQPTAFDVRTIAPENWNEQWEASVQPLVVGSFLVTPSWKRGAMQEGDLIRIEIDPKMSFGTGYHATTRLMLELLPSSLQQNDRVLDAGTGTGILAIAAAKLGAAIVLGVDIDPWSERNARENCLRNGVSNSIEIRRGDVDDVPESGFDVILANIQLDVIARILPSLKKKLTPQGRVVVSGILVEQASTVAAIADDLNLSLIQSQVEGEWWAAAFRVR